jgi:hypothetical protein
LHLQGKLDGSWTTALEDSVLRLGGAASPSKNAVRHTEGLPERSIVKGCIGTGKIGVIEKVE